MFSSTLSEADMTDDDSEIQHLPTEATISCKFQCKIVRVYLLVPCAQWVIANQVGLNISYLYKNGLPKKKFYVLCI